jgi:DNA-directed RNA polymerase alpha subunit
MKKTCPNGHTFYKSSDCPTCPTCEKDRKDKEGIFVSLAAPARRALENEGIKTLEQLACYSEQEILALHGMGKSSLPQLLQLLLNNKLTFRK